MAWHEDPIQPFVGIKSRDQPTSLGALDKRTFKGTLTY